MATSISRSSHFYDRVQRQPIPFEFFVEPLPSHQQPFPSVELHDFSRIPLELQSLIVKQCDAASLWQLMRTSSFLRTEAASIFWTRPDVWYSAGESGWLRASIEGYFHLFHHQREFWKNVRQIHFAPELFDETDYMSHVAVWSWKHVLRDFPAVEEVLMEAYMPPEWIANPSVGGEPRWEFLQDLVRKAPHKLNVRLVAHNARLCFGQPDLQAEGHMCSNQWNGWRACQLRDWIPRQLIVPPSAWNLPTTSPLYDLEKMKSRAGQYVMEKMGLEMSILETHLEDMELTGKYYCPSEGCTFEVQDIQGLCQHVFSSDYRSGSQWNWKTRLYKEVEETDEDAHAMSTLIPSNSTHPIDLAWFVHKRKRIERLHEETRARIVKISEAAGEEDSPARRACTASFEEDLARYLFPSTSKSSPDGNIASYMCGVRDSFDKKLDCFFPFSNWYDEMGASWSSQGYVERSPPFICGGVV